MCPHRSLEVSLHAYINYILRTHANKNVPGVLLTVNGAVISGTARSRVVFEERFDP